MRRDGKKRSGLVTGALRKEPVNQLFKLFGDVVNVSVGEVNKRRGANDDEE